MMQKVLDELSKYAFMAEHMAQDTEEPHMEPILVVSYDDIVSVFNDMMHRKI